MSQTIPNDLTRLYTTENLPPEFVYDREHGTLYSPVQREFVVVNLNGSVTTTTSYTFADVDTYVRLQLMVQKNPDMCKNSRDRTSEYFRSRFVTINYLECTIDREKLVILSICLAILLIACVCLSLKYYTWLNGGLI